MWKVSCRLSRNRQQTSRSFVNLKGPHMTKTYISDWELFDEAIVVLPGGLEGDVDLQMISKTDGDVRGMQILRNHQLYLVVRWEWVPVLFRKKYDGEPKSFGRFECRSVTLITAAKTREASGCRVHVAVYQNFIDTLSFEHWTLARLVEDYSLERWRCVW